MPNVFPDDILRRLRILEQRQGIGPNGGVTVTQPTDPDDPPPVGAPSVSSVTPNTGPSTGGTTVSIVGQRFTGATSVSFGGVSAAFTVQNDSAISATTPVGSPGASDVRVTTPSGTSPPGGAQFTYVATAPTVNSLTPNTATTAAGINVAITGASFTGATKVSFGLGNWPSGIMGAADVTTAIDACLRVAYAAGFINETNLLAILAIAVAGSGLSQNFRYFRPDLGYRPAADFIGVEGPGTVSSGALAFNRGRFNTDTIGGGTSTPVWINGHTQQLHSERGVFQINSTATQYDDGEADYPQLGAVAAWALSSSGANFNIWTVHNSGIAQTYYDAPVGDWPALRPKVQAFLNNNAPGAGTWFDPNAGATSYTVNSSGLITALAPPHVQGSVQVFVTTPQGTNASSPLFSYTAAPPPATPYPSDTKYPSNTLVPTN